MVSHRSILLRAWAALLCAAALSPAAIAAEQPLSAHDFSGEEGLSGICVTAVPGDGTLSLGSRQVRSGDVLTAEQIQLLTFSCPDREEDAAAVIRYLPIREDRVEPEAELVLAIRGRRNDPPAAEDSMLETYKNLPNEGLLCASDPEGGVMTYTLVRSPRRGEVILREDGSFLYTPKKNKVGRDSFTYTVSDEAGNVSREATVTIDILKPTDSQQYTDTAASGCRFEAEWLRSTGIFSGETVSGQLCFNPDREVSRGQFLAMLMQVLDLPVDRGAEETGFLDEAPGWLKPYLAAALRSGIISGYPADGGIEFKPDQAVSETEAALMVARAMEFALPAASLDLPETGAIPLTRANAAKVLYKLDQARQQQGGFLSLFK